MGEKPAVILFSGIPGAGKTAIARALAKSLDGKIFHIQTDGIRKMIHRPTYSSDESRMVYMMLSMLGRKALENGYTTILDGTFLKSNHRREAFKALRNTYGRRYVVSVTCSLENALKRNASRKATVPQKTIRNFYKTYEPPAGSISINSDNLKIKAAVDKIMETIRISSKDARCSM